ncbi:two pore potassium channel a-like [Panicum miliaceum]|uniref:Two pore potassium channel a-like n=1 Tax=Panicum miliaceum TaxID=4540 RepID=A0A3L6S7D1_PANMI|nr:two pore potassium channel a-like [Panicum miliaceum]
MSILLRESTSTKVRGESQRACPASSSLHFHDFHQLRLRRARTEGPRPGARLIGFHAHPRREILTGFHGFFKLQLDTRPLSTIAVDPGWLMADNSIPQVSIEDPPNVLKRIPSERAKQISGKTTNRVLDALYFVIITMTSVGYGDLVPNSDTTKLLACAFVFIGMAMIALFISKAADYFVEKQKVLFYKALHMNMKGGEAKMLGAMQTSRIKYKFYTVALLLAMVMVAGTLFLWKVEKLSLVDSSFCVCATITALGYGAKSFSSKLGRVFAIFWIITSTIILAQFFMYLAELYAERRQKMLAKWVLNRRITTMDLEAADLDGDRQVDAAEFVPYKLKELGKISQEEISSFLKEFEKLDVDQSGTLSTHDLTLAQASQSLFRRALAAAAHQPRRAHTSYTPTQQRLCSALAYCLLAPHLDQQWWQTDGESTDLRSFLPAKKYRTKGKQQADKKKQIQAELMADNSIQQALMEDNPPNVLKNMPSEGAKRFRRCRSTPADPTDQKPEERGSALQAKELFKDLRPSFRLVGLLLFVYLLVGVIIFYLFMNQISGERTNRVLDAMYFVVVTMTSVGYGDRVPNSDTTKLLACAFVFIGMAIIALFISKVADYLVENRRCCSSKHCT